MEKKIETIGIYWGIFGLLGYWGYRGIKEKEMETVRIV